MGSMGGVVGLDEQRRISTSTETATKVDRLGEDTEFRCAGRNARSGIKKCSSEEQEGDTGERGQDRNMR